MAGTGTSRVPYGGDTQVSSVLLTPGLGFSASGCVSIVCDLMDERTLVCAGFYICDWSLGLKKKAPLPSRGGEKRWLWE